jgi:hypothetical protein
MKKLLYEFNDLKITEEDGHFFAEYDAGAHQVVRRKDEISEEEAQFAVISRENAVRMLFDLQRRLIEAGTDPYVSNVNDRE